MNRSSLRQHRKQKKTAEALVASLVPGTAGLCSDSDDFPAYAAVVPVAVFELGSATVVPDTSEDFVAESAVRAEIVADVAVLAAAVVIIVIVGAAAAVLAVIVVGSDHAVALFVAAAAVVGFAFVAGAVVFVVA